MYTVHLKDIILYGKHGVYAEEQLVDAPFSIDISCSLKSNDPIQYLEDTLNYAAVFSLLQKQFSTPFALLETLAVSIEENIKKNFPLVKNVRISIFKLDPPIAGMQGRVGITYES